MPTTVNQIFEKIGDNKIDYGSLPMTKALSSLECDINVIIPIRGRRRFIDPLIRSLNNTDKGNMGVCITFVEHSHEPEAEFINKTYGVNYIHLPCGIDTPFNKCLAMNVGAVFSAKAKHFLFHDLDLMVNKTFFLNILKNAENKKAKAIQTFNLRRVLFCTEPLTVKIIEGKVKFDDLNINTTGVLDNTKRGAPGGSIMVDKDLFFKVGGYDPELWHSYSPEDLFFWDKVSIFAKMEICDNPVNEVYHLYHPLQQHMNPDFKDMMALYKRWKDKVMEKDKIRICNYKRDLIKEYGY